MINIRNVGRPLITLLIFFSITLGACSKAETPTPAPTQPMGAPTSAPSKPTDKPVEPADTPEEPVEKVTLIVESWFGNVIDTWDNLLIPAFNAHYPNIEIQYLNTDSPKYNAALNAKLEGGTAGDIITCRGFDASLALFEADYLTSLNDLPGMENFSDVAKTAWVTDDRSDVFCVPVASVMQGFIYNADLFEELGLSEPATEAEFFEVLDAIKDDGRYSGLSLGTLNLWETATMGFENIGPNYWKGEEGRWGIINGTQKFTDPQYVAVWESLAKWAPYLVPGYQAQSSTDSLALLETERAVIYPAGSWNLLNLRPLVDFEMGIFRPPLPEGATECYISDHTDYAMGMNAATEHPEEARIFLEWLTTAEFADLYSNGFPGFFSLSNHDITIEDPLANEFLSWRNECETTIRISYQILSRHTEPNLENELWNVTAEVINGNLTPEEAAQRIQTGLESWYEPQQ